MIIKMLNILKLFLINLIEMKWNEEKRQAWLEKNSNKIDKAFNDAMVVYHVSELYDEAE